MIVIAFCIRVKHSEKLQKNNSSFSKVHQKLSIRHASKLLKTDSTCESMFNFIMLSKIKNHCTAIN